MKKILKITFKTSINYLEKLSLHQELQFWWRLKLSLSTDPLQYYLPLNILFCSAKLRWLYQKTWAKLLSVRSLSCVWKEQRWAWLNIAAEGCRVDSSCGGNIYSQVLSTAPRSVAR